MKIVKQSVEVIDFGGTREHVLKKIELAGRTCYKSEDAITTESATKFVKGLIKRKHMAMLEHHSFSFKWITDRGVTHELVRHRIASYAQESTRYVNYGGKDMQFILPVNFYGDLGDSQMLAFCYIAWKNAMREAEDKYNKMISEGAKPQLARSVLPNSLKTEIIFTMNLRQLHDVLFPLRFFGSTGKPHPQIEDLAHKTLCLCQDFLPEVFNYDQKPVC